MIKAAWDSRSQSAEGSDSFGTSTTASICDRDGGLLSCAIHSNHPEVPPDMFPL